jgi:hypothetical protein
MFFAAMATMTVLIRRLSPHELRTHPHICCHFITSAHLLQIENKIGRLRPKPLPPDTTVNFVLISR